MFKRGFYTCECLVVGLLCVLNAGAQDSPTSDYTTLGDYNTPVSSGEKVCPSLDSDSDGSLEVSSTSTFRVVAATTDAGDLSSNTFEWVVYGGWITEFNGSAVTATGITQNRTTTDNIRYSYYSGTGTAEVEGVIQSYITVEWDTTNFSTVAGWVAVRQSSEDGCSDGKWSIYTNSIQNTPPEITSCPSDSYVPYSYAGDTVTLTAPEATDDGCNQNLSMTYTVQNPEGTVISSGDDDNLSTTVNSGDNLVTWVISDGSRSDTCTYYVIVEPAPEILNVAWINPSCGLDNGSILITDTTDYNFYSPLQFILDGTYSTAVSYTELAAGDHTLQARVVYADIDGDGSTDVQYSEEYSFTLHATAAQAVDIVPAEGDSAVVASTSCSGTADGTISIVDSAMTPQNSSVTFDGSSDYLLLNKAYKNTSMTAFSVAAWIKTSSESGTIISFDNSEYYHMGLSMGYPQLKARSADNDINSVTVDNANYQVNDGDWHLIVVTYGSGEYNIYVDGVLAKTQTANGSSATIGKGTVTRYGMIGAKSTASTFGSTPSSPYFTGQIAEAGILDDGTWTAANVTNMMTGGMGTVSMTDHWVLNDVPSNISATDSLVFTDAGNEDTPGEWARFYGGDISSKNAPNLYSWSDDTTAVTCERDTLAIGTYTLSVKDIFGCGSVTQEYNVTNGDEDEPLILWNVSVGKTATQIDTVQSPDKAVDGFYDTYAATSSQADPWWEVALGGNYPVRMIRVTTENAVTKMFVMTGSSPFSGETIAEDKAAATAVDSIENLSADENDSVIFDVYGKYVRIRAKGTTALELSEVEVLTSYQPASTRTFYLTGDGVCTYTITPNDATVDPVAYDACNGPVTLTHNYSSATDNTTLEEVEWDLGDAYSVTWTAIDDNNLSSTLEMNYEVVDTVLPVFVSDPFNNVSDTMTYCDAQTYKFPVPGVTDNYVGCAGTTLGSITLYRDGWVAYSVDVSDYDSSNPDSTTTLSSHMKPGDHTYVWEAVDYSGNTITDTLDIHIEAQPLLREVRVAPISCHNTNDAIVYFSSVESEEGEEVTYILRPIDEGDDITSADSVLTSVAEGTYQALISVNGCESNVYSEDIEITNPDTIELNADVTDVQCNGNTDGSITLSPTGGSETNILHLMDNGYVTAANYSALDRTDTVMIECWIFLDSLSSAMNWNAGLFGVGSAYGLEMVNGELSFYAGSESVTDATDAVAQRTWQHIAGYCAWNGTDAGTLTLYVDGDEKATATLSSDPSIATGEAVYMGYYNADTLNGFVRNARIWSDMPSVFSENMRLTSPIEPESDTLIANYKVNESGGTKVYNTISGGSSGTISGTYANQRFAYYWLDPDGNFLSFEKDLSGLSVGTYNVSLYDPLGCYFNSDVTVDMGDEDAPTMTFYSDHDRDEVLGVGSPIVRYTSDTTGNDTIKNITGDCYYFPYDKEFDPDIDDGVCDASGVTLSFTVTDGAFGDPSPAADAQTLDGTAMTGSITLEWTASDGKNSSTQEVTYYTVDDEAPSALNINDSITRYTDEGSCTYTVAEDDLIPTLSDNCDVSTGRLYNNLNNSDTLTGYTFDPGVYTITWSYDDKEFSGEADPGYVDTTFTLTVLDQQMPEASCTSPGTLYLDDDGEVTIDYTEVNNESSDNCGTLTGYRLTRNIAYYVRSGSEAATQSSDSTAVCSGSDTGTAEKAIDGNTSSTFSDCSSTLTQTEDEPWWQVDLGASDTLYAVNVYSSDAATLNNFWVIVSTDSDPSYSGDLASDAPMWSAGVADSIHYTSDDISGSYLFSFDKAVEGQYVRIWMDHNGALSLSEVEVYGSASPASTITMDCDDVRYSDGTFSSTGLLLTVIDEDDNIGSCLTDATIVDDIGPTIITQNINVPLDATTGTLDLNDYVDDYIDDGSSDNCQIDSMWVTSPDKNCNDIGTQTVTVNAVDIYGNTSSLSATVTIADESAPAYTVKTGIKLYLDDDGEYIIQSSDIFATVSDNCTDSTDLFFSFSPDTVFCGDSYINLAAYITDGSGNKDTVLFYADDEDLNARVQVIDNKAPVASLENFTLTIPEDGDSMIRFEDIIPYENLYDNCDGYDVPTKLIKYDTTDNWCAAGNEGTGASAFNNIESYVTDYGESSEAYTVDETGTYLSNLNDQENDDDYADIYISDDNSAGTKSVYYYFSQDYQFNQSRVMWHTEDFSPETNIAPSASSVTGSEAYSTTYPLTKANDEAYSDITDAYVTSGEGNQWFYVTYGFSQEYTLTSTEVVWPENENSPAVEPPVYSTGGGGGGTTYAPYIECYNYTTGTWETVGTFDQPTNGMWTSNQYSSGTTYTLDIEDTYTDSIRIYFYGYESEEQQGHGQQQQTTSYHCGIAEWYVYTEDVTQDCELPTSDTLYYYNTSSSTWTSLGSFDASAAAEFYDLEFSSNITTDAFRLDMTTTDERRVGVREWRVYGREVPTEDNSACTKYTCDDVQQYVTVWLKWEDSAGNIDTVSTQVWVEPYFEITNIQLMDCAVNGEQFWSWVSADLVTPYTYDWTQESGTDIPDLFSTEIGGDDPTDNFTSSDTTIAQMRTSRTIADGTYTIYLEVSDSNSCYDTFDYTFDWDSENGGGATSVKETEECKGDTQTYSAELAIPNTYWETISYTWAIDDGVDSVAGGTGNDYMTVDFPTAGVYNVESEVSGDQIYVWYGDSQECEDNPDVEPFTGTIDCSGQHPCYDFGSDFEGPFVLSEATEYTSRQTFDSSNVIRTSSTCSSYYTCEEGVRYEVTVYEVTPPEIYAYDAYNTEDWIPAADLQICPQDTIWYRVNNYISGTDTLYASFSWSIFADDGTTSTGRRLSQGNWYNDSIQVVWDQYPTLPRIKVVGYNELDCADSTTIEYSEYSDAESPVLQGEEGAADNDCSAMDTTSNNTAGQCGYTFQNLPAPLMTDDCRDRIKTYGCEVDTDGDGTSDISGTNAQGYYPVGTYTITWYATDYSEKTGYCTQEITVIDNEAPQFNKTPTNVNLYATDNGKAYFTATTHNLTATDNCGIDTVYAQIDTLNDGTWDYGTPEGLDTLNDPDHLRPFPMDTSLVRWIAKDIHGNADTVTFYVVVKDNTDPIIAELDTIKATTDDDECTHTFNEATDPINYPDADDLSDNVSSDEYLASTVEFVSRSDGETDLYASYDKGTTTITWRVTDEAGNYSEQTQKVVITDNQEPWFDTSDDALQDTSVSYCDREGFCLSIPLPDDNCGITNVASITYTVVGGKSLNYSQTISRANGTFDPHGTGLTDSISNFYQYVNTYADSSSGTHFTVTWTAVDEEGNSSDANSVTYSYTLHVEIEPLFSDVTTTEMTCGGADNAKIAITTSTTNTDTYHYDRNYTPEFSIDNGNTWYGQEEFDNLDGGDYTVKMRVNGCVSSASVIASIDDPTAYTLSVAQVDDVVCPEDETGSIELTMGGGATGQLHFQGTGCTVTDYDELDVTTEGSVAAWVYLDDLTDATLFSKGSGAYSLSLSGEHFQLTVNGTSLTESSLTVIAEYWYYVVGTWNASGMEIFVNGTSEATNTTGVSASANTDNLVIGSFNGILRDVAVWNTVISGDIPTEIYDGKEDGLVGLWQLNDGTTNYANNSTQANGFGNDATGCSSLWTDDLPQPGDYTWKKDNTWYSDHINLEDLGIGTYSVLFVDPYNCPDPDTDPLGDTLTIEASDNVAPVIEDLDNLVVYTDEDVCYYTVDKTAADTLTPDITDASNCEFDITWKIVINYNMDVWTYTDEDCTNSNENSWNKIQGAELGRSGTDGLNTVTVTTLQNDDVTSTETYTITVEDNQNPVADGKFDSEISMDLDENGVVELTAVDFNDASSDNCTDAEDLTYEISSDGGTTWGSSINFDCDDIGDTVTISFRVTDEAGNSTVETGDLENLVVKDVTAPVISETSDQPLGPYCATTDATDTVPACTTVSLDKFEFTGYSDNCGVTRIRYKRYYDEPTGYESFTGGDDADWVEITDMKFDEDVELTFYEGETTMRFELSDGASDLSEDERNKTEADIFVVTVLPKPSPGGTTGIE